MGKKSSFKGKKQYGQYKTESRFSRNKVRKLQSHLKRFPDDIKAKAALERLLKHCPFTRKSPNNEVWSKSKMNYAQQLKKCGYKGNLALVDQERDQKLYNDLISNKNKFMQ